MNERSISDVIAKLIDGGGMGIQSDLARHLGVSPQSVNKWSAHQTQPRKALWSQIEDYFELNEGDLWRHAGYDGRPVSPTTLTPSGQTIPQRLAALEGHVAGLNQTLLDIREAILELHSRLP